MKILVTGGTGFTGSHIVKRLISLGHTVSTYDSNTSKREDLEKLGAHIIVGDLTNKKKIFEIVKGMNIIFHIAAAWQDYDKKKDYYYTINVEGTKHLLDAALLYKVKRFIHCSTVGVLGDVTEIPATEETPVNPGDIYQETKLQGEQLVISYKDKLPVVVIRPTGIYGPYDKRLLKLFKSIHNKTFMMLGKGDKFYHLTYIDDLVDAFMLAMKKGEGQVYIISGPEVKTTKEIVVIIAKACHVKVRKLRLPIWPFLVMSYLIEKMSLLLNIKPFIVPRRLDFFRKNRSFSSAKAQKELGYKPKVTMKEGITKTVSWYKKHRYL